MSKNYYYLIARNKASNDFQIIDIGTKLEEIDLYTGDYKDKKELMDKLISENKIYSTNTDIYIALPKVEDKKKYIYTLEVLYDCGEDSIIGKAADSSLKGENIVPYADNILNNFCHDMKVNSNFFNYVVLGKTNIYKKFTNYFIGRRYDDNYKLKYLDNGWARKSYALIRNIYDATSKFYKFENHTDITEDDVRSRKLIEEKLLMKIGKGINQEQMNLFEIPEFAEENSSEGAKQILKKKQ